MIKIKKTQQLVETVRIKELFRRFNIPNKENAFKQIKNVYVNTPYGYHNIVNIFRTERQPTITSYFSNGSYITTSSKHRLMVNNKWTYITDIQKTDIITTENGITFLTKQVFNKKNKILYDIEVDVVHCYYSNKLLSHNSWCMIQLAINALKQNKNVLYVTLETRRRQVALRFDSLITGIPLLEFRSRHDEIKKGVYEFFKDRRPPFIEEFPTGGLTIPELYSVIKRIRTKKCKDLDLLVIDYLDIMDLSPYGQAEWQNLKAVYEDARKLGFNEGMPVWSATHPNQQGIDAQVMTYDKTSGGSNKFKNVDFILTINKKKDDDKGVFGFVAKNRLGPSGLVLDMELDTYSPLIHIGNKMDPNSIKKDKDVTDKLKDLLRQVNG